MHLARFIVAGAALAAVAAPAAQAKGHQPLACGQTIVTSTRLDRDLTGCGATGLVIGADGVTLDLHGHAIRGTNAAGSVGIVVDGHAGVTIRGGTVSDFFDAGVSLHASPHGAVHRMRIVRIGEGGAEPQASAGVRVDGSPGTRVTRSLLSNDVKAFQSDGVDVLSSPGTLIRGNRIVRNSWNGIVILFSPHARAAANILDGNGNNGLEANGASDGVAVTGNLVRGNTQFGLVVGSLQGARVNGNRLSGNTTAGLFFFDLIDSVVVANRAERNGVGIQLEGGQFGSHGNTLLRNTANRNGDTGILVEGGADANRIVGNEASRNRGSDGGGIVVAVAQRNVVRRNVTNRNVASGIRVIEDTPGDASDNVLARNRSDRNGGHGIDAVDGTLDGGGNRAARNATPPDCVGVTCA
jgi:parallel beta-helix repeat protein